MIARVFSSVTASLAVTTSLLFVMQILIATGEDIIVDPRVRFELPVIVMKTKNQMLKAPPVPSRPIKPIVPPATKRPGSTANIGKGIPIPYAVPSPPEGSSIPSDINYGDGPLVNIYKVYPTYPARAAIRSLEGTVLVQYDVTETGAVVNVVVLESTDKIFDKAAIAAAYRFKYKPETVEGVPYATTGLRNLFRFEMEK
ncbi:MAG: TonB family protein [Woeseiaceae bacterium]